MVFQNFVYQKIRLKPEIDNLRKMGVKIEVNSVVGKLFTVDELMQALLILMLYLLLQEQGYLIL